ncbi:MAG: hypothetical protein ACREPR_06745 [Brasilonema sp.]
MEQFFLLIFIALGGSALAGSVKVVNQGIIIALARIRKLGVMG